MYELLRFIPKNHLSALVGFLVRIPLPSPFNTILVRWFARRYGIDTNAATLPLESYRSIGDLFVRELKPELRPIEGTVVMPIDGTLRHHGPISEGSLEQIKGQLYSVRDLFGGEELAKKFNRGYSFNFYLSPQDYHHIHSPAEGAVVGLYHIPGALWPVNDWSLHSIPKLFTVNERVFVILECALGSVAIVMVGATNVGQIEVPFAALKTNRFFDNAGVLRRISLPNGLRVACGEKIGTFRMGSAVVLLFDERWSINASTSLPSFGSKVCFGQKIF